MRGHGDAEKLYQSELKMMSLRWNLHKPARKKTSWLTASDPHDSPLKRKKWEEQISSKKFSVRPLSSHWPQDFEARTSMMFGASNKMLTAFKKCLEKNVWNKMMKYGSDSATLHFELSMSQICSAAWKASFSLRKQSHFSKVCCKRQVFSSTLEIMFNFQHGLHQSMTSVQFWHLHWDVEANAENWLKEPIQ